MSERYPQLPLVERSRFSLRSPGTPSIAVMNPTGAKQAETGFAGTEPPHPHPIVERRVPKPAEENRLRAGGSGTGATGLEPATSGVTGRRSNQLNYAPRGRTIVAVPLPR